MTRTRFIAGGVIAALAIGAFVVSPAAVTERAAWVAADPVRLVAVALALAAIRPFLAWPTTLLALLIGYGFGPIGIPFALALIVATSIPPYLVARRYGRGGRLAEIGEEAISVTGTVRGVTASRLIPLPSDVVSVASGVANVPLGAFVLGTALGEIPWAVAGVVAGASVETLTTESLDAVLHPEFIALIALGGVALLVGPAYRYYRENRENERANVGQHQ
ncbi:TVP38/TMEM64 family protein [Haloferax namakaokahaiae]|uniref:TVP38/TMEM64 family protein n=1 Tax=Haloferax namakaokahaiae TaxID=1748331 RepID=A0ABD5ZAW9_9EURY